MNLSLFFKLIVIETIFILAGTFGIILFLFLYFGSGATASSEKAIITGNVAFVILVSLPLCYGILKYRNSKEIENAKSYLYSGLIVTFISSVCLWLTV